MRFLPVAAMPKSLLEQLPEIVARGRQQAEKILESLEGRHRARLAAAPRDQISQRQG